MAFDPDIDSAIAGAASQYGLDPSTLAAFARIESGGDPNNVTGSYKGLFQLSPSEFSKYGGRGDIFDPTQNANAAASKLKAESAQFANAFGRQPTASELYLIHQQGFGGASAHLSNPDATAWQNMASTAEGRQKGDGWAKQAIWGNVPDSEKAKYGSVDNMTSRDFMNLWANKVARFGGDGSAQPTQVAEAVSPTGAPDTDVSQVAAQAAPVPAAAIAPPSRIDTEAPNDTGFFGSLASMVGNTGNQGQSKPPDPTAGMDDSLAQLMKVTKQAASQNGMAPLGKYNPALIDNLRQRLAGALGAGVNGSLGTSAGGDLGSNFFGSMQG